jgi:hypothetical protein
MIVIYIEGGETVTLASDDRAEAIIAAWKEARPGTLITVTGEESHPKTNRPYVVHVMPSRITHIAIEEQAVNSIMPRGNR